MKKAGKVYPTIRSLMEENYALLNDENFRSFHKAWNHFFEPGKGGIAFASGYNVFTYQTVPRISFDQNLPFSPQVRKIKRLIPYIKPVTNVKEHRITNLEDGDIFFEIFEHTCSEYGSYDLVRDKNGRWKITKMAWHRYSIVKEGTLDELLKFIYDNLPYERKKGVCYHDED